MKGRNLSLALRQGTLRILPSFLYRAVLCLLLRFTFTTSLISTSNRTLFRGGCRLALLGWLVQQPWFYTGLGVSTPSNHAALILFLMVGPVFSFFLQPLLAWSSRRHEYQADAFAAAQADPRAMIRALVKLYRENASTLTTDAVHSAFYDSHPPAAQRIAHLQAFT